MKRLWISVKRGLIREPKHRIAMGECVWLFQYMLDVADWETGKILDWKDQAAADDMQMPIRTLREQRRKLEDELYISSTQKQYGQEVTVNNWTNPRSYTGEVLNPKVQGDAVTVPQGYTQGYTQGSSQDVTPTYDSNNKQQTKKKTPKPPTPEAVKLYREVVGRYPNRATYELVVDKVCALEKRLLRSAVKDDLKPFYVSWTSKGYNPQNQSWMDWAVSGIVPQNGKAANISEPKSFNGIKEFLSGN